MAGFSKRYARDIVKVVDAALTEGNSLPLGNRTRTGPITPHLKRAILTADLAYELSATAEIVYGPSNDEDGSEITVWEWGVLAEDEELVEGTRIWVTYDITAKQWYVVSFNACPEGG